MPEGDTIRRLADRMNRLAGAMCRVCITRDPRLVGLDLVGRVFLGADAYGKHAFARFDDGRTLHSHLLMTGSWEVGPRSREPEWRRRVELAFGDGWLSAIDVPLLGVVRTIDEHTLIDHLGPDLCGAEPPDLDEATRRLLSVPDEPLTAALLDQRNIAGFGNVYVNEIPFLFGVSPFQPVGSLGHRDDLVDMLAVGAALIRTNARLGPQNTTGRKLPTPDHWVYGKKGRRAGPCPVCGERLVSAEERDVPWGRGITWCPSCQPRGDSTALDRVRARRLLGLHPARRDPLFRPRGLLADREAAVDPHDGPGGEAG